MNTATIKYNKIAGSYPSINFPSFSATIQGDIVVMISLKKKRKFVPKIDDNDNGGKRTNRDRNIEKPPFLTPFQDSSETKYKLGYTTVWKVKRTTFVTVQCIVIVWSDTPTPLINVKRASVG